MILKSLVCYSLALLPFAASAKTITVTDMASLEKANKEAVAGDIVVLKKGVWNNITITLTCSGTSEQPITFKAEKPGDVAISGKSKLQIGGSYLIIDGLYFTNGYAGSDPVIKFSAGKKIVANNCRLTNTVINDFNNPQRLDENYWIALYGKQNRIDHCTFQRKKNLGVLIAVILDDERSRENHHSIDHNYFGERPPLASNAGEIIRVGVSQHCEFNSFTNITNNYFEHCNGETEIISIKSCGNLISSNLFKECQGGVVLRHGNFNTVRDNIFLGNGKPGTGGVRIINKEQWVVNNLFYKCRGDGFRSPLSVMNGVPNSPANRYLPVSNAVIANNSFFECTPISFCEGSDAERSMPPANVFFANNIFYNTTDTFIYRIFDKMDGFYFSGNVVSRGMKATLEKGFDKANLSVQKAMPVVIPMQAANRKFSINDSLQKASVQRISSKLNEVPGFGNAAKVKAVTTNALTATGAKWFAAINKPVVEQVAKINCSDASGIYEAVASNTDKKLIITLTGREYHFTTPLYLQQNTLITTSQKDAIVCTAPEGSFVMQLKAGKQLTMQGLRFDLSGVKANTFISTDTSGSSNHSGFALQNCIFNGMNSHLLYAATSSVADSIVVRNCMFSGGSGLLFNLAQETDGKGYYSVERLIFSGNKISEHNGAILDVLRSGKDESTMGPLVEFTRNTIDQTNTERSLITLDGVQRSLVIGNTFTNSNEGSKVLEYKDQVRAVHICKSNQLTRSGSIATNQFVISDMLSKN